MFAQKQAGFDRHKITAKPQQIRSGDGTHNIGTSRHRGSNS